MSRLLPQSCRVSSSRASTRAAAPACPERQRLEVHRASGPVPAGGGRESARRMVCSLADRPGRRDGPEAEAGVGLAPDAGRPEGERRQAPDLAPLVVGPHRDAVHPSQAVMPSRRAIDDPVLQDQERLGVGPEGEGEQGPVDQVTLRLLVAVDRLREQPEVAVDVLAIGLPRGELGGEAPELPEPLGRRLGGSGRRRGPASSRRRLATESRLGPVADPRPTGRSPARRIRWSDG